MVQRREQGGAVVTARTYSSLLAVPVRLDVSHQCGFTANLQGPLKNRKCVIYTRLVPRGLSM